MDSRERVTLALAHKEPDRGPIDYWASPEINAQLLNLFGFSTQEDILRHFDVDFRYIDGSKYIGPDLKIHEDGSIEDHWGVLRLNVTVGSEETSLTYKEVANFPFEKAQTLEEIRNYPKWPNPYFFDYTCVREQVAKAQQTGIIVIFMGDRMHWCSQLKTAMYLRGIEQILFEMK